MAQDRQMMSALALGAVGLIFVGSLMLLQDRRVSNPELRQLNQPVDVYVPVNPSMQRQTVQRTESANYAPAIPPAPSNNYGRPYQYVPAQRTVPQTTVITSDQVPDRSPAQPQRVAPARPRSNVQPLDERPPPTSTSSWRNPRTPRLQRSTAQPNVVSDQVSEIPATPAPTPVPVSSRDYPEPVVPATSTTVVVDGTVVAPEVDEIPPTPPQDAAEPPPLPTSPSPEYPPSNW